MPVSGPPPAVAIASTTVNRTTPTPSLNRDSPAIVACRALGTFTVLNRPSTATGSVGLISAPKTSAQTKGMSSANHPNRNHIAPPTTKVEIRVPRTAITEMVSRWFLKPVKSACSAPANSRKLSIPFIRVSLKSICRRTPTTLWPMWAEGTTASSPMIDSDAASAITTSPIVCGRCRTRWLTYPNRADNPTRIALMLKMPIASSSRFFVAPW